MRKSQKSLSVCTSIHTYHTLRLSSRGQLKAWELLNSSGKVHRVFRVRVGAHSDAIERCFAYGFNQKEKHVVRCQEVNPKDHSRFERIRTETELARPWLGEGRGHQADATSSARSLTRNRNEAAFRVDKKSAEANAHHGI